MVRDIDATEVRRFAGQLRLAAPQHVARIAGSAKTTVEAVAAEARVNAPKDRPWLSTDGIATDMSVTGGTVRAAVFSPRDPRGQNVGFHVEHGTADTPPQPFLTPAFERGKEMFIADVARIVGGF